MTPFETRRTTGRDGTMLSYRCYGKIDHHAVLLLHSLGTDGRMWDECIERMNGRFGLIVPDTRGHGDSGPSQMHSVELWAEDLDAVVRDSGAFTLSVVGISMGGIQAIEYAASYPDRVEKLVVADSFLEMAGDVRDKKIASIASDVKTVAMSTIAKEYVAATFIPPYPLGAAEVERAIAAIDADSYVAATACCFSVGIAEAARAVAKPSLVLWGDRDDKTPRVYSEQIARTITGARIAVVPEAGHLSSVDNPIAFSRLLMSFLGSVA